jgi:hypothetical protein
MSYKPIMQVAEIDNESHCIVIICQNCNVKKQIPQNELIIGKFYPCNYCGAIIKTNYMP